MVRLTGPAAVAALLEIQVQGEPPLELELLELEEEDELELLELEDEELLELEDEDELLELELLELEVEDDDEPLALRDVVPELDEEAAADSDDIAAELFDEAPELELAAAVAVDAAPLDPNEPLETALPELEELPWEPPAELAPALLDGDARSQSPSSQ